MYCCLLVSKKDSELIQDKKYNSLSFGLRETIKALAKSGAISKVSIGSIHLQGAAENTSNQSLSIYKKFLVNIHLSVFKISKLLDWCDAQLNRYSLNEDKLQNEHIMSFQKKFHNFYKFIQKRNGIFSFTSNDPEIKKNLPIFDFLLRGSGLKVERGAILSSYSKLGCLSLHHGDNSTNRGGPVGFWEVYYRQSSGITAQILTNELDGGKVIYRARIRTLLNPLANKINIYKNTCPTLLVTFNKIKNLKDKPIGDVITTDLIEFYTGSILKFPKWHQCFSLSSIHLIFTSFFLVIRFWLWMNSFWRNPYERWGFAATTDSGLRIEKWPKATDETIYKNQDDWFADPFFANVEGSDYIVFEQFSWLKRRGTIAYMKIDHNKNDKTLTISNTNKLLLENKFHLSYPFTFERSGNTYMIPENSSNGLWLYQLRTGNNKFNGDLEAHLIKQLLTGRCIDPTLFHYEGVDYLFVTEMDETKETLFLYTSEDITSTSLHPHPLSPILVDHSLGRSAGRIFINTDGKIIRPTQKCDRYYGEGIIFSEIKIDKEQFEIVREIDRIIPTVGSIFRCLHHFDSRNGMFVIDFVKRANTHPRPLFKVIKK